MQILATVNATLAARELLLKSGTVVDATLTAYRGRPRIAVGNATPRCTRPKSHICVDADSGLAHTVVGTAANVNDVKQAHALVHGRETDVFADAGYQGVGKCKGTQDIEVNWHVAMRRGKRKVLDKKTPMGGIQNKREQGKARIRAKVEHRIRVIKRQFEHVKCATAA